ncbi:MerR family transcriptional regulator [Vibrio mimicus]|uniref:MerR family transcriptional regulator n=1 Tax=Vibrio mimicus TaxID=674 RepID=UPI0011D68B65|nr:MerR family transcriptional regulator [Vibrio mimicus]TXY46389.1 MerR family transcriptional regulator [Vibrio mimicus]
MACDEKRYAIREVAEITGVKPVTLRAWQRRYNLVQPDRTEKGHRLFTEQDIEMIRQIQSWLAKGVAIGKVGSLLQSGVTDTESAPQSAHQLEECEALLTALAALQRSKAEQIIATVLKEYPLNVMQAQFVQPVAEALERVKGPLRSLQMGLFRTLMLTKLAFILDAENKAATKGKCLCISLDEAGSLNAWLWALAWAEKGYQVTLLEAVDDIRGLPDHAGLAQYQTLAFHAHRALPAVQQQGLERLQQQFGEQCVLSDVLQQLQQ